MLLGDRSLTVPAWIRPALEQIRAGSPFAVGDLAPHLDRESRTVLCRRLVREGLLEAVS